METKTAMHEGVELCTPDVTVTELAKRMRNGDIGAIPIGENDRLIGMVTDRDIVIRCLADDRDATTTTARDVMTEGIAYCKDDDDILEAMQLMQEKQLRRLPVVNKDKRLVGMLSLGDFAEATQPDLTGQLSAAVSAHH
ncbi:CBS domain-containing protein [uncultured Abyssibacter sp.]|uniref:CBS domain-containing protein n=1 Tax=uncultured Abyssibacter sp. TaxID=2320202 RepID=UPI0032B14E65